MRGWIIGLAATALLGAGDARAQLFGSGGIFCINCAEETTADASFGEQLIQAAKQIEQLTQEIQTQINTFTMLQNQIINMASLVSTAFNGKSPDILRLMQLMRQASILTSNTSFMVSTLGAPGGYPDMNLTAAQWQVSNDLAALSTAMTAAGQLIDGQQDVTANQTADLETQQGLAAASPGIKGVLQANGAIAATAAQTSASQNNASLAALQTLATGQTTKIDQDAAQESASRHDLQLSLATDCSGLTDATPWFCQPSAIINGATGGAGGGTSAPVGSYVAGLGGAVGSVGALATGLSNTAGNIGSLISPDAGGTFSSADMNTGGDTINTGL